MTPFQIIRKKSLYPWVRNTTSRWSNGTTILTTFILCSKPKLILNYQRYSMPIKTQIQYNKKIINLINDYKINSLRLIKKEFPFVRKKLWKEMFWSRSFCLLTTGGSPIEVVKKYIENQGIK